MVQVFMPWKLTNIISQWFFLFRDLVFQYKYYFYNRLLILSFELKFNRVLHVEILFDLQLVSSVPSASLFRHVINLESPFDAIFLVWEFQDMIWEVWFKSQLYIKQRLMVAYSQKTFSFFPYRNQVRLSLTRFLVFSLGRLAELFSTSLYCMNCWLDYWMNLVQCFSNYVPWSHEDSNKWPEKLPQGAREKWVDTFLHPINQSSTIFSSPQTAL